MTLILNHVAHVMTSIKMFNLTGVLVPLHLLAVKKRGCKYLNAVYIQQQYDYESGISVFHWRKNVLVIAL